MNLDGLFKEAATLHGLGLLPHHAQSAGFAVWTLLNPDTGDQAAIAVSDEELSGVNDWASALALVEKRFTAAKKTLENLERLRQRQMHEMELVSQGWTPPAGWKPPHERGET